MASTIERRRSGLSSRRQTKPMSEINVTPFVDVMLVLLIIFMITAPLLTTGVQVDLPNTKAAAVQGQDEPVAVSINRQGHVFIGDDQVSLEALAVRLDAIATANPDIRVFVRGDQAIDYGHVMAVVGVIHQAGLRQVALVTHPTESPDSPPAPAGTGSSSG